jgi:hypothetical protein
LIVQKHKITPLNFKNDLTKPQVSQKNITTQDELKRGVWDVYAEDLEIKIVVKESNKKGYALVTTINSDGDSY